MQSCAAATAALGARAHRVLELPAAAAIARDAPQLQRADLRDVGLEADRDELARRVVGVGVDQLLDRIELDHALRAASTSMAPAARCRRPWPPIWRAATS